MSERILKRCLYLLACGVLLIPANRLMAQTTGGNNNIISTRVVGGIQVDATGVLSANPQKLDEKVRENLLQKLNRADADIDAVTELRMISLRGLEDAIEQARQSGKGLPADVQYMAGLQRIDTIVLSPETNDILIGGPAEGWKLNDAGQVVGVNSGTPVIHLDDFLVAMRTVDNANQGQGISVSIDPTEQGIRQLEQFYRVVKSRSDIQFGPAFRPQVEQAMGLHNISLTGVPEDSHFSQVLVAADYKMKRLAMGLEKSPINGLPSFMELVVKKNAKMVRAAPRFWMECNYQPVAKTEDGTVWNIRGQGVKALTQESHFDREGKRTVTQKQNRFAVQWADAMTEKFDELAAAEPVFRELRNVMDLSVVAAIIRKYSLTQKVGLEIPVIQGTANVIQTASYKVPKTVPTESSFVKLSGAWLVSASGGVQLDSWQVAQNTETVPELAAIGQTAIQPTADRWWWNTSNN